MTDTHGSSSCPDLPTLEAWVVEPDTDRRLDDHVETCTTCREAVEDIRENLSLMSRLAEPRTATDLMSPRSDPLELDDYELLDEIHRGGQGVVFRAMQRSTNRPVALKVLLAGTFATTRQRRRFEREVEIVAALDHPNVVTVHDSGETPDGRLWLAMQLVDGLPLDQWLDAHPEIRTRRNALVGLMTEICDGVAHAHMHGVIHRDLKPGNILVDHDGRPRIVDFGLARPLTTPTADEQATVTVAGQFMGTLSYASPEQTVGGAVDTRSDVYALGVILYQMLSGHLPCEPADDIAETIRIIRDVPPPSLRRSPLRGTLRVDEDLDTVTLTALAKDPERRYASAAALRDDLRRAMLRQPIDARRDSGWYLLRTALARHRVPAIIALLFVVLSVTFSVTLLAMYRRASTEAAKLNQINIFLEDTLGSVDATQNGGDVTVRQLLDEAAHWIDLALEDQPNVASSIRTTVASSYRNLGDLETAEQHARQSLETRRLLHGDDHLDVAESHNLLGMIHRDRGRLDEAEASFREALMIRRRHHGDRHLDVAFTLAHLASVHRERGEFDQASARLHESLAVRRRVHGDEHSDVAMCLFHLGRLATDRGDPSDALRWHEEALSMRTRVLHPEHPDLPRSLEAVGRLHLDAGDLALAHPHLRRARDLLAASLGNEHPRVVELDALLASDD